MAHPGGAARILVVEDESIIAQATKLKLEQHGYEVMPVASSINEAEELAALSPPHVIIMDAGLQGAFDGVKSICRSHSGCRVPVIYMTGDSSLASDKRLLRTDPIATLVKPVPTSLLLETMGKALDRTDE